MSAAITRLRTIRDVRLRLVDAAPAPTPSVASSGARVLAADLPRPAGTITYSLGRWWIATESGFALYDPAIKGGN